MEKWMLHTKKGDFRKTAAEYGISPVLARIMVNRGVKEEEQIRKFLKGTMEDLYDPILLLDMEKAVNLLQKAIDAGETIAIASDFDVDGIFSSMVLHTAFQRVGAKCFVETPNRVTEGYGLNRRIVDDSLQKGAKLLITCDNGIAALDAVQYAKDKGLTVIVTDHHEVPFEEEEDGSRNFVKPVADAIVNPKQKECQYPFPKLCGAGVAFKLAQVLYQRYGVAVEEQRQLIEYTAIATVADVMDLEDENRIIVKTGLKLLEHTNNKGLQAILKVNQLDGKTISAYHIGFIIGPCFNAAGRLETVKIALDLLMCEDEREALVIAEQLKALNESRKEMTVKGVEQAIEKIEHSTLMQDKVLVVKLEDCHESLVGIIAGRIRERYHKPVLVFTDVEDGIKGSGRSIEAYNMFEELNKCKKLLTRFGGHPMAAGVSMETEKLEELRRCLNENTVLTEEDLCPVVWIDVPMPIGYISEEFVEQLELLEPFGKGNTKPIFAEQHFRFLSGAVIGKNKNVFKCKLINDAGDRIEGIYFGDVETFRMYIIAHFGETEYNKMLDGEKNAIDLGLTYYPTVNEFRDQKTLQIVIQNYCAIARKKVDK
ncbi:single-stranded-DNA-specific exonuclease RecJ [Clostridium sp. CAG:411]|jgi:single-stranded-DNA-specific exonuclease|nr:single-stranded-DNA-specific exonuclease RecJ [Lachnospiraceae bacterium]CDE43053.1 single-stranded-DNA-specific exonuclease RecJ [Clostridium sp. CAG:411]